MFLIFEYVYIYMYVCMYVYILSPLEYRQGLVSLHFAPGDGAVPITHIAYVQ